MVDGLRARRFCPWCGAPLREPEGARQDCTGCGQPYYHNAKPCVAVLAQDEAGRVLLARRAVDPGRGLWDLPGGFCEPDETPEDAVRREFREETGAEVEPLAFLGHVVDRYGEDGDHTLNAIYVARIAAGTPAPDDDVAELAWFGPDELPPPDAFAFANTVEALSRWRSWKE